MAWQIIQTDFSIFQTGEWKSIYCQAEQNKIILLSYKTTDFICVCLLPKKGHITKRFSPFMPSCGYFNNKHKFEDIDLCYGLKNKVANKVSKEELTLFGLSQKQVPARLLIKSYLEPISSKYLNINLDGYADFLFIKKEKIPLFLEYMSFLDKENITLTVQMEEKESEAISECHNQILFANDLSSIKELIKANNFYFYFSMNVSWSSFNKNNFLTYQMQLLYDNLSHYINLINIPNIYKPIQFYEPISLFNGASLVDERYTNLKNKRGKIIGWYFNDPEMLKLKFEINKLRAQIISHSYDPTFFVAANSYLNYLESVYPDYSEATEINRIAIDYLKQYLHNFNTQYPFFEKLNKMIFCIFQDVTIH